jgi:hypothetical protein
MVRNTKATFDQKAQNRDRVVTGRAELITATLPEIESTEVIACGRRPQRLCAAILNTSLIVTDKANERDARSVRLERSLHRGRCNPDVVNMSMPEYQAHQLPRIVDR